MHCEPRSRTQHTRRGPVTCVPVASSACARWATGRDVAELRPRRGTLQRTVLSGKSSDDGSSLVGAFSGTEMFDMAVVLSIGCFAITTDEPFSFPPSIKREQIESLHELGFVDRAENVILLGPPGVGKTHLAISLAMERTMTGRAESRLGFDSARFARSVQPETPERDLRESVTCAPPLFPRVCSFRLPNVCSVTISGSGLETGPSHASILFYGDRPEIITGAGSGAASPRA